jgi:hypothetical protein
MPEEKWTPLPRKYDENVRKFSVTLHYYSPRAYKYVRKHFDNCLPHIRTLASWYCTTYSNIEIRVAKRNI